MTFKHGIPAYADERTHKFFQYVYVGKHDGRHGENENGYKMSFNTRHEELEPSLTYGGNCYCVYCGERPYSIQPDHLGFHVTGYLCLCKDATDEVENNKEINEALEKHHEELQAIKRKAPKPSIDVKRKIIERKLKDDYYLDDVLKALRID